MKTVIIFGIFIVLSGFIVIQNSASPVTDPAEDWDLPEGTYYIRNRAGTSKYLDVSWSCKDASICQVQLWSLGNTTSNNKWIIKRAGLPLISPYTLQSPCNNRYLIGGNDFGKGVFVEDRLPLGMSRERQEWRFKFISSFAGAAGVFKIYNEEGMYLDAVNDCVSENGCKVQMWSDGSNISRQWILVKLN